MSSVQATLQTANSIYGRQGKAQSKDLTVLIEQDIFKLRQFLTQTVERRIKQKC